jgi:hypothetical protein
MLHADDVRTALMSGKLKVPDELVESAFRAPMISMRAPGTGSSESFEITEP